MKLYRQFFLLPSQKRGRIGIGLGIAYIFIVYTFHQQIHEWRDIDYLYRDISDRLFSGDESTPQWFKQEFLYISAITSEMDASKILINAIHEHPPDTEPFRHYSVAVEGLDHICVKSDYDTQTVAIAVPQENQSLSWALAFKKPSLVSYDSYFEDRDTSLEAVVQHCSSSQTVEGKNRAFGKVALASLGTTGHSFYTEIDRRLGCFWFWSNADTYLHKLYILVPFNLLLCIFFLYWIPRTGPLSLLIHKQMSSFELEGTKILEQLFKKFSNEWLNGSSPETITRKVKRECGKIKHSHMRETNRERKKRLRLLVDEQRAAKLQKKASVRAKRAKRRIRSKRSTVSQEIKALKKVFESEQSGVARILESGIVEALKTDSPEETVDPEESKRDALIEQVWSCSFDLIDVEDMELIELERFAKVLRDIKRGIDRQAWKKLVEGFNGNKPKTYRRILKLAEAKEYKLLETLLLNRPQTLHQSAEIEIRTEELLLLGKRVIIIGGRQGLGPLYCEGILNLGANSATYFHSDETTRLKDSGADLALIFWRQVPHRQQDLIKSKKIPIVFLDEMSKSAFLSGAVKMIELQL